MGRFARAKVGLAKYHESGTDQDPPQTSAEGNGSTDSDNSNPWAELQQDQVADPPPQSDHDHIAPSAEPSQEAHGHQGAGPPAQPPAPAGAAPKTYTEEEMQEAVKEAVQLAIQAEHRRIIYLIQCVD